MSSSEILKSVINLEETLKCKVCKNLLHDPLLIGKCGHTLCKNCFIGNSDSKCPICSIPLNCKDSLEDKQLKDVLVQLNKLKNILQNKQDFNKNFVSENLETSAAQVAHSDIPSGLATIASGNKIDSPKCSTSNTKMCKIFLSKNASRTSSSEGSIIEETPNNTSFKVQVSSKDTKKSTTFPTISERKKLSTNSSNSPVQSPANLNKKNHKGETLLHREVIKGNIAKVKKLLDEGAMVNTQDNNGWTPLHEASNHGYVEITKLLLDHGALVNVPSLKDNITPLHDALINDKMQVAILLVSRGADLHLKTSLGNTALDLCKNDEDRKILIDACSPFISSNVSIPNDKVEVDKSEKIVFLPTNLSDNQKLQLQKCAQLLKADIVDEFTHNVTHIITSCDNMGNCTRTMKILLGILSGKWIINFQWIDVCLEYKQRVDEKVFEVQGTKNQPNTQGPKHGRENINQKLLPLFHGFYFYLHGQFTKPTPEREDLCSLIHLGGGKILAREPRPETVSSEPHMIPYHAASTSMEDISHIILYQERPPRDFHVHSGHICTVQVMWLIECISTFKILDPKKNDKAKGK